LLCSIESSRSTVVAFWIASNLDAVSLSPVKKPDSLNKEVSAGAVAIVSRRQRLGRQSSRISQHQGTSHPVSHQRILLFRIVATAERQEQFV